MSIPIKKVKVVTPEQTVTISEKITEKKIEEYKHNFRILLKGEVKTPDNDNRIDDYVLDFREPGIIIKKSKNKKYLYSMDLYIGDGKTPMKDLKPMTNNFEFDMIKKVLLFGGIFEIFQIVAIILSFLL